jgi:thymidine kinase
MQKNKGTLEVICGPMFSGKSEELIRRLRRANIAKQKIAVFKPELDTRRGVHRVTSHNGNAMDAHPIAQLADILTHVNEHNVEVIGIDEVQFFPYGIIEVISTLVDAGKRVIAGGLDLDFRGIPFGPIPTLLAIADEITKLRSICTVCCKDAHFTQRLVNNIPANFDDPIILLGAEEAYQARCRSCYIIDKKPIFSTMHSHI